MYDRLHMLWFIAALASPLVAFPVVWCKWPKVARGAFLVYLGSYVLLSLAGRYVVANHGGSDWRREWLPRYLMMDYLAMSGRTRTHLTPLGALYWPCILVDRTAWHRTATEGVVTPPNNPRLTTAANHGLQPGSRV